MTDKIYVIQKRVGDFYDPNPEIIGYSNDLNMVEDFVLSNVKKVNALKKASPLFNYHERYGDFSEAAYEHFLGGNPGYSMKDFVKEGERVYESINMKDMEYWVDLGYKSRYDLPSYSFTEVPHLKEVVYGL
jgi:hypothetical protein